MANKENIIPAAMDRACPDKCPVCGEAPLAIFRNWKPETKIVVCEFLHKGNKECKKVYNY